MNKKFKIKKIFLIIGTLLLTLNVVGLLIPLRNPEIYSEKYLYFENDIIFSEKQMLERIDKIERNIESNELFITQMNNAVFNGIAHYWKDEGIDKYNLRIPPYENYILFMASYINPNKFRKYEFSNLDRAIERGIGLCSQHALILCQVLEDNGIDSKIITLPRHVVVTAEVEKNKWWIFDPDFGVIIKKNIYEIEQNPEIVSPIYYKKGYDSIVVSDLTKTYENVVSIHDSAFEYSGVRRYYFEKLSYIGIWVIPILLIAFSVFYKKKV